MGAIYLFVCLSLFGGGISFLLDNGQQNVTGTLTDHSYNNLIQLLVVEKNSRHLLENKLDALSRRLDANDDLHRKVNIQLDKDKNNRESTLEKLVDIEHQLRNLTESRDRLMAIASAERDVLQRFQTNISTVQLLNNEMQTNMTKAIESVQNELFVTKSIIADKNLSYSYNISRLEGRIDSLTRHDAEPQIGFAVYTPGKSQADYGPIKFGAVRFNKGNLYNEITGKATCKVAGLYFFTMTIVREPGVSEAYCKFNLNNKYIESAMAVGNDQATYGYASGSTSVVYHLNIGDTLYVGGCVGVSHIDVTSGFQGFLITADSA